MTDRELLPCPFCGSGKTEIREDRPRRDAAQAIAFSWIDTKETRPAESRAIALLNDSEQSVSGDILDALRNYDVRPVLWSQRETVVEELAA